MDASSNVMTRVPVSLRLPASVMSEIEAYAAEANVRKTDAFLHFLNLGIESERVGRDGDRLRAVEARLDEILSIVRGGEDVLAKAREAIAEVAVGYPGIEKAYVFGSVARGEASAESDIDLRLVIDRDEGFSLHELEHFCKEVERKTGRSVDVVTARNVKNKALAAAIERDKVLVFER